jgi:hypothetical protein
MSRRARHLGIAAAITGLLVLGIVEFPQAQNPSRSERNGFDLSLQGLRLDAPTDWFGVGNKSVSATARGVVFHEMRPISVLHSRRLAVFPDDCYLLTATGMSRGGIIVTVVPAGGGDPIMPQVSLPPRPGTVSLAFSAQGRRSVEIDFAATTRPPGTGIASRAGIKRVPDSMCSKSGG